jgi:hypothetical protein
LDSVSRDRIRVNWFFYIFYIMHISGTE